MFAREQHWGRLPIVRIDDVRSSAADAGIPGKLMPSLYFVLPHWLYWGTLIVFPLIAWALVVRQRRTGEPRGPSLFVAYLLWLCAGFLGLHRFYLKSLWGFLFIPVFL